MRDFGDRPRFTIRTIPEVFELVSVLKARFGARGFKLGDGWSREALVNAIFVEFDAMSPADQAAFLRRGLARLEALLNQEGPAEGVEPPPGGPPPDIVVRDVTPRSARRKKGNSA